MHRRNEDGRELLARNILMLGVLIDILVRGSWRMPSSVPNKNSTAFGSIGPEEAACTALCTAAAVGVTSESFHFVVDPLGSSSIRKLCGDWVA